MNETTKMIMRRIDEKCLEERIRQLAEVLKVSSIWIDDETRKYILEEYQIAVQKRRVLLENIEG